MGRRLGQHFLKSPSFAGALADSARINSGDVVLEIGPGTGVLTAELLARGARVIAIEKDMALVAWLQQHFKKDIKKGVLTIIPADVRDETPRTLNLKSGEYTLAANIPYYITGDILRQFLTAPEKPKTIALLIQKEVALRITSKEKESILSLSVKAYGAPRLVSEVPRENFSPPPSVDSAIIAIENISRARFRNVDEKDFFRIVKAGFAAKRKLLRGNLTRIASKVEIIAAFEMCGLPEMARAEDVPLEMWFCLASQLTSPVSATRG